MVALELDALEALWGVGNCSHPAITFSFPYTTKNVPGSGGKAYSYTVLNMHSQDHDL